MTAKPITIAVLIGVSASGWGPIVSAEGGFPIAGTQPSERPHHTHPLYGHRTASTTDPEEA